MKVLVVSGTPYSNSNRGIDILTYALSQNKEINIDHLVFPNHKFISEEKKKGNIIQKYSKKLKFGYKESLMWYFPKFLTKLIFQYLINNSINMNFNEYDIVILESGKPILLQEKVSKKSLLIYRQSDSVKEILSRNKYFQKLEETLINKSNKIYIVKENFKKNLSREDLFKAEVIENGFNMPEYYEDYNPYLDREKLNLVYLGYALLDIDYLEAAARTLNNIHIIGECLKKSERKKLEKYPNIKIYGNMKPEKYIKYIKYADAAIVPYKDCRLVSKVGLTSKYIMFMYFNLKILSKPLGIMSDFKNLDVIFVNTKQDFYNAILEIKKNQKINYNLDFVKLNKENKAIEYIKSIEKLIKEKKGEVYE